MTVSALYSTCILEHNRAPHNFGPLHSATHSGEGHNASCGDSVHMALEITADGIIRNCHFEGESCAICTASASMLSEIAVGKNADSLLHLQHAMQNCLHTGKCNVQELGVLQVFSELQAHPARRACALLPFAALIAALKSPLANKTQP